MINDAMNTCRIYEPVKTYNLYVPRTVYNICKEQRVAANDPKQTNNITEINYGTRT